MVSRNLERANENDGFKMTALEIGIRHTYIQTFLFYYTHRVRRKSTEVAVRVMMGSIPTMRVSVANTMTWKKAAMTKMIPGWMMMMRRVTSLMLKKNQVGIGRGRGVPLICDPTQVNEAL